MTEEEALKIAQQAVTDNDTWADRAIYEVDCWGEEWAVSATRIEGYGPDGEPLWTFGGDRLILIDAKGKLIDYIRGR
jgi:hypothetical protein